MTKSPPGWLPSDRDQLQAQCSLIECGTTLPVYLIVRCGNRLVLVLKRNGNLIVNTPLRALGTELIPVSWQSTSRWLCHKPCGRLPLLSTRPAVTFPAKEITPLPLTAWPVPATKLYCLVTRACMKSNVCRLKSRQFHFLVTILDKLFVHDHMPDAVTIITRHRSTCFESCCCWWWCPFLWISFCRQILLNSLEKFLEGHIVDIFKNSESASFCYQLLWLIHSITYFRYYE